VLFPLEPPAGFPAQFHLQLVWQARKRRYLPLVMGDDRNGATDCTMRPKTHGRHVDQPPASSGQGQHQQKVAVGNPRPIGAMHALPQNPAARWPTSSRPEWFLSREVSGSLTDRREASSPHSRLRLQLAHRSQAGVGTLRTWRCGGGPSGRALFGGIAPSCRCGTGNDLGCPVEMAIVAFNWKGVSNFATYHGAMSADFFSSHAQAKHARTPQSSASHCRPACQPTRRRSSIAMSKAGKET
jgi:hypothetical protein